MKNCLFDLDGTLVDTLPDLVQSVNLTRASCNLPPKTFEEVKACVGDGMRNLVLRAIPEFPDRIDALLNLQRANYLDHCLDSTFPYPGVLEVLARLKEDGWRLACVTNKPAPAANKILLGLGFGPFLDAIVGGGETALLKPNPEPLLLAASRMHVSISHDDWMVGDHFTDLRAARLLSIQSCFCSYGYGRTSGETFTVSIDRFADLPKVIA